MPAGAKMSIASMKAEPMMPNMSVTSLATIVSTKASEGVIFCTPVTTPRLAGSGSWVCLLTRVLLRVVDEALHYMGRDSGQASTRSSANRTFTYCLSELSL